MPKPTLTVIALSIVLIAATAAVPPKIHSSGVFDTPTGAMEAGPLRPGDAYEFTVSAEPGQRLSFATMLVPSNDLFYAPSGEAGMAVPPVDRVLRVTVTPAGEAMMEESGGGGIEMEDDAGGGMQEAVRFTVRVENRSDGVMVPAAGTGEGLESLTEDGDPAPLAESLAGTGMDDGM